MQREVGSNCDRLTWINVVADKLQNNISCSYSITDGVQMLQHGFSEILSDLVPHCYHSSDLELHCLLCMHSKGGLHKILTDSCHRKPCCFSEPRTPSCVLERKQHRITVKKQIGRSKRGQTRELVCKSHGHVCCFFFTTEEELSSVCFYV